MLQQLQAFVVAVYSRDDQPLRQAPERIVACASGMGKQIKIRASAKGLNQKVMEPAGASRDACSESNELQAHHSISKRKAKTAKSGLQSESCTHEGQGQAFVFQQQVYLP